MMLHPVPFSARSLLSPHGQPRPLAISYLTSNPLNIALSVYLSILWWPYSAHYSLLSTADTFPVIVTLSMPTHTPLSLTS